MVSEVAAASEADGRGGDVRAGSEIPKCAPDYDRSWCASDQLLHFVWGFCLST